MKERGKEEKIIRVARFRMGNEIRKERYWERVEDRRCRLCGWAEKSWEHVMKICDGGGDAEESEDFGGGWKWRGLDEKATRKKEKGRWCGWSDGEWRGRQRKKTGDGQRDEREREEG